MQLGDSTRLRSSINVTPLVDVVLVLLIIFMVMAPHMRKGPGPEVDLPATEKPRHQADEGTRIQVTIDDKGVLWIDDRRVDAEKFGEDLRAAAGSAENAKVVVRADATLPFGEVRRTMIAIEEAGFHGVGLIAENASAETQGG